MNDCNVPLTGHNAKPPTSAKLKACWVSYQYRILLVKELRDKHDDYICLWLQATNFPEEAHMLGCDAVMLT
jgi:hypothetical protein